MARDYIFEPPGDVQTLIADPGEALTLFWITGALIELDEGGRPIAYADVFTRIGQASRHFASVGLGSDHVRRYIRKATKLYVLCRRLTGFPNLMSELFSALSIASRRSVTSTPAFARFLGLR